MARLPITLALLWQLPIVQAQTLFRTPQRVEAAHLANGALWAWGESGLWRRPWPGQGRFARVARGPFAGPGGCFGDADGDGNLDWVLQEGDRLWWLPGPDFARREPIDTEAGMSDCLVVDALLGHRGILVAHRGLQVRFYEYPQEPGGARWPYHELYSFYTASFQAGLLVRDIDRDGYRDLLCGNYWIRSPEAFHLPWRLFAIHTYNETAESANVRLAWLRLGEGEEALALSQAAVREGARVALFRPPQDPRELWDEQRLDKGLSIQQAASLVAADLDHDQRDELAAAERVGRGRIWLWRRQANGSFRPRLLAAMPGGVLALRVDERGNLIAIGRNGVSGFWRRTQLQ